MSSPQIFWGWHLIPWYHITRARSEIEVILNQLRIKSRKKITKNWLNRLHVLIDTLISLLKVSKYLHTYVELPRGENHEGLFVLYCNYQTIAKKKYVGICTSSETMPDWKEDWMVRSYCDYLLQSNPRTDWIDSAV